MPTRKNTGWFWALIALAMLGIIAAALFVNEQRELAKGKSKKGTYYPAEGDVCYVDIGIDQAYLCASEEDCELTKDAIREKNRDLFVRLAASGKLILFERTARVKVLALSGDKARVAVLDGKQASAKGLVFASDLTPDSPN